MNSYGGGNISAEALATDAFNTAEKLWWASGVTVKTHPGIGAVWFLVSLFWAKVIIDIIHVLFPGKYARYLCLSLGLLGIALGLKGKWLPQNMDVTFVAVLFIYLGYLWRENVDFFEKWETPLFLFAAIFWVTCIHLHFYIEMATRQYPFILLTVIEAVCGSFVVCCISKGLAANFFVRMTTQILGIHSLLIFLFHYLDWIVRKFWQTNHVWQTSFRRVIIVLAASFIFLAIRTFITEMRKKYGENDVISER